MQPFRESEKRGTQKISSQSQESYLCSRAYPLLKAVTLKKNVDYWDGLGLSISRPLFCNKKKRLILN